MTRKPYIKQTDAGWTIFGHTYRITIEEGDWNGNRQQYKARIEPNGFNASYSYFSPAPGRDFDNDLAECACSLFSLGYGDTDREFFDDAPGSHFDQAWIAEYTSDRNNLSIDRETFERRANMRRRA